MRDRQTENATETRVSSTPGYPERDTLEHVCRRCPNRSSFGCWFGLPMVCIWLLAVEWSIIIGSDLISVPDRSSLGTERRRQRKRPLAPPSSFLALHAHTNPIPCLGWRHTQTKTHPCGSGYENLISKAVPPHTGRAICIDARIWLAESLLTTRANRAHIRQTAITFIIYIFRYHAFSQQSATPAARSW